MKLYDHPAYPNLGVTTCRIQITKPEEKTSWLEWIWIIFIDIIGICFIIVGIIIFAVFILLYVMLFKTNDERPKKWNYRKLFGRQ